MLDEIGIRSLYARAARDYAASIRVPEKCGIANARGQEIDVIVLVLLEPPE